VAWRLTRKSSSSSFSSSSSIFIPCGATRHGMRSDQKTNRDGVLIDTSGRPERRPAPYTHLGSQTWPRDSPTACSPYPRTSLSGSWVGGTPVLARIGAMNPGRAALGVPALAGPQRVGRLKAGLQADGSWVGGTSVLTRIAAMNSGRAALGVPALAGPQRVNRLKAGLQADGSWKAGWGEGEGDGRKQPRLRIELGVRSSPEGLYSFEPFIILSLPKSRTG
jgi:hypothetical protein